MPLSRLAGLEVATVIPLVQVDRDAGRRVCHRLLPAGQGSASVRRLIWVALAGKTLGPVGFVDDAIAGVLPWKFGWTCGLNDIIWWPVFWSFALRYGEGGLANMNDKN